MYNSINIQVLCLIPVLYSPTSYNIKNMNKQGQKVVHKNVS